jgi:ADP-ribosylglycohydrolase
MSGARTDRASGALLGLAVGDALGTTYEFEVMEQPPYPALAVGPATDIVGGGPFGLAPGQVTDDTQLAVCLACSLAEHGRLELDDLARRYVAWSLHAFDIGNQTRAAILSLQRGEAPSSAGLGVWRQGGCRAAGNGSLMRTAPLAIALGGLDRTNLIDAAIAESMITHADPRCLLACAAFDGAIAAMIADSSSSPIDVARDALQTGARRLGALWVDPTDREHLARARVELESDLDAACSESPDVHRSGLHLYDTAGFVRVAFRLAFWHAKHTGSWREAVVDVSSRGGDADTNAAIVGALLGARDGASAIPPAWVEQVLGSTQPGPPDWADAHHPRHLLALAE